MTRICRFPHLNCRDRFVLKLTYLHTPMGMKNHPFSYTLSHRGINIFTGEAFTDPSWGDIESDAVVRGLMRLLCRHPGDTDEQRAFAKEYAEYIHYYVQEIWRKQ